MPVIAEYGIEYSGGGLVPDTFSFFTTYGTHEGENTPRESANDLS